MDFKKGGPWNTEKYCRLPWLADKKNFQILDALEWSKQSDFDLGDSLLIVSALKPFLFFLCLPFFLFAMQKSGGAMAPWPPRCHWPCKTSRLLREVEFWPTFEFQTDITLAIFWEKLQNHTL